MTDQASQASIQTMRLDHYEAVTALWQATPGVGLSNTDSREGLALFLERNPGLSFIALIDERLVGAVLCGHDGRRGHACTPEKALFLKAIVPFRGLGADVATA